MVVWAEAEVSLCCRVLSQQDTAQPADVTTSFMICGFFETICCVGPNMLHTSVLKPYSLAAALYDSPVVKHVCDEHICLPGQSEAACTITRRRCRRGR